MTQVAGRFVPLSVSLLQLSHQYTYKDAPVDRLPVVAVNTTSKSTESQKLDTSKPAKPFQNMSSPANLVAYLKGAQKPLVIEEAPIPKPGADEIIVENKALAINPIDAIVENSGFLVKSFPVILGLDSAGVVLSVGTEAANHFKKGDRVLALTESIFSPNQDKGGFQKYSAVRTLTTSKIPSHVSFVDASTFPLATFTAALGLFHSDHLALSSPQVPAAAKNGKTVLVWGGASSVGANAIQLAVAAGYRVVATASEKNFDLVRGFGASEVLDYTKASVFEQVSSSLSGSDFVGTLIAAASGKSFEQADEITKAAGGISHIVSAPLYPDDFKPKLTQSWVNLKISNYPEEHKRVARELFADFFPRALEQNAIDIPLKPRVLGNGLEYLQEAVDTMKAGVSAEKLVVELS